MSTVHLGAGGRGFESRRPDQFSPSSLTYCRRIRQRSEQERLYSKPPAEMLWKPTTKLAPVSPEHKVQVAVVAAANQTQANSDTQESVFPHKEKIASGLLAFHAWIATEDLRVNTL